MQDRINMSKNGPDKVSHFQSVGSSRALSGWQQLWDLAVTLIRDAGSPSITSQAHWQKTPPRNEASPHDSWKYVASKHNLSYFDNRRFGGAGKSSFLT